MKNIIVLFLLLLISAPGCATAPHAMPAWITTRIAQLQKEHPGNPPLSIWQYRYKSQTVYYFPPQCCDIPSTLLDEKQNRICSPDGGMTGNGDGKCTDFFKIRTEQKLVWRDSRSR
jgi:hypothetical protein